MSAARNQELIRPSLRQIWFSGSGKPQDLVGKVALTVSSEEPTKAAKELRQGNLSGKENARMGAAGFLPQGGKLEEVFSIERQNGSMVRCSRPAKANCSSSEKPRFPAECVDRQ